MDETRPGSGIEPVEQTEQQKEQDAIRELFEEAQHALNFGENQQAIELFKDLIAVTVEPEAEYYNKLGIAYARLERLEEAREAFEAALDVDSRFVPALSNLGNIYFSNDDLEAAEEYYQKAIKHDPEYSTAYNNLAALYKRQGKIGEAVNAMKKSQRLALKKPADSYYDHPGSNSRSGRRGLLGCLGSSVLLVVAGVAILLLALSLL